MLYSCNVLLLCPCQMLLLCPCHMLMLGTCRNYMSPTSDSGQHVTRLVMMHAAIAFLNSALWLE